MTSPGSTVFAVLARFIDAKVLESIVAPTIADLQFEVESTETPWRRQLARAHGYVAIGRLLLWHGLIWRSPMRTVLTVIALGIGGAALLVETFSVTTSGPAQVSPFFLMAVLVPVLMRVAIGVNTRRKMFLSCMAVGTVMSAAFLSWFAVVKNPGHAPWYAYALNLVFLLGCVAATSAIVAIVATKATPASGRNVRSNLLGVVASAGTFAICYSIIGLLRHRLPGGFGVLSTVSWAVFLGFFFILVSVIVYLPILVLSRRVLDHTSRMPLAVGGALFFPIPMLAFPFLQGRFDAIAQVLLRDPAALVPMALPYLLAGATLGWLVAAPRQSVQHSV